MNRVVQVSLSFVANPDRREALVQALRTLLLSSRAAPGCVSCHLFCSVDDPNSLYFVEAWRATEDLDRQICSTRYTRLLSLMEEAVQPPELKLRWVNDVKGLEYLESVRLSNH
jgi:quinol monooxygenase YgiN